MAVFRVEKSSNYTTMSNYHLQDKTLSLKAKGLLSQILSLPDNWDYSVAGLVKICKEGKDCIVAVLQELEQAGYITRRQQRTADGKLAGMEYIIYERPHATIPCPASPDAAKPHTGKAAQNRDAEQRKISPLGAFLFISVRRTRNRRAKVLPSGAWGIPQQARVDSHRHCLPVAFFCYLVLIKLLTYGFLPAKISS